MSKLPSELQHLKNLIESARSADETYATILRRIVKKAADEADIDGLVRMADTILQCGIEIEQSKNARWN